jgi:hypothetical protein
MAPKPDLCGTVFRIYVDEVGIDTKPKRYVKKRLEMYIYMHGLAAPFRGRGFESRVGAKEAETREKTEHVGCYSCGEWIGDYGGVDQGGREGVVLLDVARSVAKVVVGLPIELVRYIC